MARSQSQKISLTLTVLKSLMSCKKNHQSNVIKTQVLLAVVEVIVVQAVVEVVVGVVHGMVLAVVEVIMMRTTEEVAETKSGHILAFCIAHRSSGYQQRS